MVEAWLAWQLMVYSVLCNSWLIRYGLQGTLRLMVGYGRGGYRWFTVFNVTHDSTMDWSVLIWFTVYGMTHGWCMVGAWQRMVYSVLYNSCLRNEGSVLIWFTVYRMTHGGGMVGAWQRIVYSVLCNSWLKRYGLQCTLRLMVENGRGGYRWFTVFNATHGLTMDWSVLIWFTCTVWLMVEAWLGPGSGWFTVYNTIQSWLLCSDMVYSVQYNSWLKHGLVCSEMVYSVPHDSWLRHGWGLAADGSD